MANALVEEGGRFDSLGTSMIDLASFDRKGKEGA